MAITREEKVILAYKLALARRRRSGAPTFRFLAAVDTAKMLNMPLLKVLSITNKK